MHTHSTLNGAATKEMKTDNQIITTEITTNTLNGETNMYSQLVELSWCRLKMYDERNKFNHIHTNTHTHAMHTLIND